MPKNEPQPPEFVLDGTFEDHDWRNAASKPESARTKNEQRTFENGPRSHPYSSTAYLDKGENGEMRWFPNKEAAQVWKNQHEAKRTSPKPEASPAEGNELQAEAEKEGRKSRPIGGVS
jgi:hypothetical protein